MDSVDRLRVDRDLSDGELRELLTTPDERVVERLAGAADEITRQNFGTGVYIRGLIEVSSYCRNDCRYCGLRRSNRQAARYRLDRDTIMTCCEQGYALGMRTFVLQGGEDPALKDDFLVPLVRDIRCRWADCAITLSLGERSGESYRALREAGATRYLLRHETADADHYRHLHPDDMSHAARVECLETLSRLGYQTGCGVMVGSPAQTAEHLIKDLRFMQRLAPQMIGMGPFIPHCDTPFRDEKAGSVELTLRMLAIARLMHPAALIPATTAMATLSPTGRLRALQAGANVVMPNLSPPEDRSKYAIYDSKAAFGCESAEGLAALERELNSIGRHIDYSRGDYREIKN